MPSWGGRQVLSTSYDAHRIDDAVRGQHQCYPGDDEPRSPHPTSFTQPTCVHWDLRE